MTHLPWYRQPLLLSLMAGLIGFACNSFPIPLFANVQLVLGNTLYVIVAILLGPWYALLAATISVTSLMLQWDSPHVYLLFCLEALALGCARLRCWPVFYAGVGFWLLLGMPLIYGYLHFFSDLPSEYIPFVVIKQSVNAMVYITLGCLIVLLIPALTRLIARQLPAKRSGFGNQLFYSFLLLLNLSLMISTLVFNYYWVNKQQQTLGKHLHETAKNIGLAVEHYLERHKSVIATAAELIKHSSPTPDELQRMLSRLHKLNPGFLTMLIADPEGSIVQASPVSRLQGLEGNHFRIDDRDYFQQAFFNERLYVSPVFLGRGFGSDAIVAISSPLYLATGPQVIGVLEGSLNLNRFSELDNDFLGQTNQLMFIVDENMRLIYASRALALPKLERLNYRQSGTHYSSLLPMLNLKALDNDSPEYVYSHYRLPNNWQIFVLDPYAPLLHEVERQFMFTFALLLLFLLLSLLVARVVGQRLTMPLELISEQLNKGKRLTEDKLLDGHNVPVEVSHLYSELKESQRQLMAHQLDLEEKVIIRTLELEQANRKLKQLAQTDPLTGLGNRRHAEASFATLQGLCQRNHEAIAVVLMDLDFFKRVNDEYGHLGGDETLKRVADLLKTKFKRDSDLISRYGGEELLLLLPMCNPLKIEQFLKEIRQAIAELEIINPEDQRLISVTVSIGALIANASYSSSLEVWLKEADANLYQAKSEGRNRVICTLSAQDLG
ncbi:diguanylate cyclase [Shewanella algae]|uniref:sensor domain-containing diguanylate cyclase n=1 Tax=Shewanella algae TaxID=38313 RepID=UPI003D7CCDF5